MKKYLGLVFLMCLVVLTTTGCAFFTQDHSAYLREKQKIRQDQGVGQVASYESNRLADREPVTSGLIDLCIDIVAYQRVVRDCSSSSTTLQGE